MGDVIRVRVVRSPGRPLALSRTDADPDAPLVPALPLVVGGAPWPSEVRDLQPVADAESDASAAAPAVDAGPDASAAGPVIAASVVSASVVPTRDDYATRADVAVLARAITRLRADLLALSDLVEGATAGGAESAHRLAAAGDTAPACGAAPDHRSAAASGTTDASGTASDAESTALGLENERLRSQLAAERANAEAKPGHAAPDSRETSQALRDARRAAERSHVDTTADGIRFEIDRTWGNRTAPGERGRWPLREYTLGADFVDSLEGLDESQLSKAIRTCVDAITGRDREIPARELHRLRSGEGGDDAYVVREDGARCMRSSVEQNVEGARRLHYWELPGDVVELGRIVHRDDIRP
ncbi:hypothetical protein [Microbacterium sp. GXF0217]